MHDDPTPVAHESLRVEDVLVNGEPLRVWITPDDDRGYVYFGDGFTLHRHPTEWHADQRPEWLA